MMAGAGAAPAIALRGITKRYRGVRANDDIRLDLLPGEVHVLLGENGAGKSTLVGILSGLIRPDGGHIRIGGVERMIGGPAEALALGIATVFQKTMLAPSLSVAEAIALGGPWWSRPSRPRIASAIRAAAAAVGVAVDPDARVASLSPAQRQQVEILRAVMRNGRVLVLDEPTAMSTPDGAAALGALMRRLAANGLCVVFVTHKLNEALTYGDRITVLRQGRVVGEIAPAGLGAMAEREALDRLLTMMFGETETRAEASPKRRGEPGRPVLTVVGLSAADDVMPIVGLDLRVAAGEILGIAGMEGNGQRQLAEALAGQRPMEAAEIRLDNEALQGLGVRARRQRGLRFVTDDRNGEGTVATFSIALNLLSKQIGQRPFWRRGVQRDEPIRVEAERLVAAFGIRAPAVAAPVGWLSGGNVQKVVLARELSGPARAIIFAKPTHGLDIVSVRATQARIRHVAEHGTAVILISADLDELLILADRIAVMSEGRIVGVVENGAGARRAVGALISEHAP